MSEGRNPFTMRASEHIESSATFLRLFGPGVLDLLQKNDVWDRVQIFRSAPGGGKTSLFRLFTPQCLLTLYDARATTEEYKDLYRRLKDLDVISEQDGPKILGVLLSGAANYAALEDLNFEKGQRDRLFFSLLNSRMVLALLRSALEFKKLNYPEDLNRLQIHKPEGADMPLTIPIPCSGRELHKWASDLERRVCSFIDSFASSPTDSFLGYETLHCLRLLRPECISFEGRPAAARSLLMFDDIHKLATTQRKNLLKAFFDFRLPLGIWLAERLEALTQPELFGATIGREYSEPITLEEFWRREGNYSKFEQIIANIADRRAKLNPNIQVGPFASCLTNALDGIEWQVRYSGIIQVISRRVLDKTRATRRYENWIRKCEGYQGTARERAISWRILEIKVERDIGKAQQQLVDLPLSGELLEMNVDSATKEAAELFLAKEFQLPYYFGFSRLSKSASSNIEQFLELASDLFEEVISARLLRPENFVLSPTRQESILRRAAKRRWEAISYSIPNGRDIIRLLEAIGQMCLWETDRPNAPYSPGVTGIAISMNERSRLMEPQILKDYPEYARLAAILSACIANNLLEASLDRRQGQKGGRTWMILYLNRLLCLHFGLPVQYGGWRPLKLYELYKYLDQGFRSIRKKGGGF